MLTVILVAVLGTIVIGFVVWVVAFGGMKRRGQSGEAEVTAAKTTPKQGRAGGLD